MIFWCSCYSLVNLKVDISLSAETWNVITFYFRDLTLSFNLLLEDYFNTLTLSAVEDRIYFLYNQMAPCLSEDVLHILIVFVI